MFIKLLVFCAVGILLPTCNCLYTFSVHKPAANYIEENDIEDIFPRASTERDLIDIRPEEAFDNEIPDVEDVYLKNDVEDNIVEVNLDPEETWKKDTELDDEDSDEEHFWPIRKTSTEKPVDEDVDDTTNDEIYWSIYNPTTTEETLDKSSEGNVNHFWPISKATTGKTRAVYNPTTTEEYLETSSKGNVNHFWPIYKATTGKTPSVYNPTTDKPTTTEENLETSSESNINILTDESSNDDDSLFSFKFSFSTDPLFDNGKDDDKNDDESSVNFFHISFGGSDDEQEKEEKPDITLVLPDNMEPNIDEDEENDYDEILNDRIKAMIRIQEVIDELKKMATEMDAVADKDDDDISPITTYDYINRGYNPYRSPYGDFGESRTNYENSGYFGDFHLSSPDLPAANKPYENRFEDHTWHDAPVLPYSNDYVYFN